MISPTERVMEALKAAGCKTKQDGTGWRANCPGHESRATSMTLKISEGDDGRCLIYCHAGCKTEDIVQLIGLEMRDLSVRRNGASPRVRQSAATAKTPARAPIDTSGLPDAVWPYHDAQGKEVARALRWNGKGGEKEIRPQVFTDGQWVTGAMQPPRLLYRLPEVMGADTVYVCEGEKAAEAARECGLIATTSSGGAKAAAKTDWSPLRGKEVAILPDNDEPGEVYAKDVARLAHTAGAAAVWIIRLVDTWPSLTDKGDMADVLDLCEGDLDAAGAGIETLMADAREDAQRDKDARQSREGEVAFIPFPVGALPWPFDDLASQGAESIGCDPSMIALPTLASLAAVIGDTREVELKKGWREPCILWTAIVAESGDGKSPAFDLALKPIRNIGDGFLAEFEAGESERKRERKIYERDLAIWKRGKKSDKVSPPPDEPPEVYPRRVYTSNPTVESLGPILKHGDRGILQARDELSGWVKSFDAYRGGAGGDSAFWLEAYGGRPHSIDRKGTGLLHIPRVSVCVTGGIQPGVFRRVFDQERRESGLVARLFIAAPPAKYRKDTGFEVEQQVLDATDAVYRELVGPKFEGDEPVRITLDSESKVRWLEFVDAHTLDQLHLASDLKAAWAKLKGGTARIALVIHEARIAGRVDPPRAPEKIDLGSLEAAITITDWFKHEARRVYAIMDGDKAVQNRALLQGRAGTIQAKFDGACTTREWQRGNSRRTSSEARDELQELVDCGLADWVHQGQSPKGGAPSKKCVVRSTPEEVHVVTPPAEPPSMGSVIRPPEEPEPDDATPDDGAPSRGSGVQLPEADELDDSDDEWVSA